MQAFSRHPLWYEAKIIYVVMMRSSGTLIWQYTNMPQIICVTAGKELEEQKIPETG